MNYQPKVVRCRLHTGGKTIQEIRERYTGQGMTYRDFEDIQRADEAFDGLVVLLSMWPMTTTIPTTCITGTRRTTKE